MGIIHTLHHTLVVSDSTYDVIISLISTEGFKYTNKTVYATVVIKICSKLILVTSKFATFGGTSLSHAS